MSELIGQQIENYRIDALLGEGGMGAVYRAYDLHLARSVAFKLMHRQFASQPEFQRRFLQEAQAAARLDHPSIVKIFSFGMQQSFLYMVMAFVPGATLGTYLKKLRERQQVIKLNETLHLLAQVADALGYAHRQGVVHRDIKPDNIMLMPLDEPEREGELPLRAMVTDFGLAKLIEGGIQTQTGTFMGTLPYMSPEQCLGKELDGRSDLYSLGVLLYQLATGRLPFDIKSPTDAVMKHIKETPPPPDQVRPGLPPVVTAVITQAIAKDPANRFASGNQFARAMRQAALGLTDADVTQLQAPAAPHKEISILTQLLPAEPAAEPSRLGLDLTAMPGEDRLLIAHKGEEPRSRPLDKQRLTIGRSSENDIPLMGEGVSRNHARLERQGSGWQVVDMGSTNGTFLGHSKLLPDIPEPWEADMPLRIGDFYLRWQRISGQPAVAAQPTIGRSYAATRAAPPPPVSGTQVYSSSGQLGMVVNPGSALVDAGGRAIVQIELLNQGATVDHFTVQVSGIPAEWVSLPQAAVQLMPGARSTIPMTLHPPLDSSATAGTHNFHIIAALATNQQETASFSGQLVIKPFERFAVDIHPSRFQNRGSCRALVRNEGNAPANFTINAREASDQVQFSSDHGQLVVAPGRKESYELGIAARQRPWLGTARQYPFEIQVTGGGGGRQVKMGQLEVTPMLPGWLLPLLGVVLLFTCLSLGAAYTFFSNRSQAATVTAVAIAAAETAAAQGTVAAADLAVTQTIAAQETAAWEATETVIVMTAAADEEAAATATARVMATETAEAEGAALAATQTAEAADAEAALHAAQTATAQAIIDLTANAPTATPTPTVTPSVTPTFTPPPVHGGGLVSYRTTGGSGVSIWVQPPAGPPIPLVQNVTDAAVLDFTPAHGGLFAIWVERPGGQSVSIVQASGNVIRENINNGWTAIVDGDWSLNGDQLVLEVRNGNETAYVFLNRSGDILTQPSFGILPLPIVTIPLQPVLPVLPIITITPSP